MSDFTGQKPRDTYGRLLQIANANDGADGTLRQVRDGKGDATPLFLSTSQVGVGADSASFWTSTGTSGEEITFTANSSLTDAGFLFAAKNNGRLRARRMQAQATSLTPVSGVLPFVQQGIVNSLSGTITSGVSGPFSWVVSSDTANALNAEGGNIYYMFGGNTFGGTAMRGGRIGLNISHVLGRGNTGNLSTETWFQTGISSQTTAAFRDGGVQNEYSGHLFGMFASAELRPGARFWNEIKAVEYNVSADAGSSVGFKFGITSTMSTTDAVEADVEEAFLAIGSRKANATASTGMRSGIIYGGAAAYWGIPSYGALIEATPSTVTGGTPPPMTAAYGIDWSLVTFGASLIRSANFGVDGSGNTGGVVTAGTTLQARDGLQAATATLASVTVTDGGTFTAFPALTVAAPLGGGGSAATATVATMGARVVRDIAAAGTGYAVNDALTVDGGTFATAAQIKVLEVTVTGGITAAEIQTAGDYSVLPSSPFTVTGGAGSAAQFRIGWRILTVSRTAGSGYQQFPAPVITADTAAMIRRPKLVAVMTGAAAALNIGNNYANFLTVTGGSASNPAVIAASGSDSNIDIRLTPKGTGVVQVRDKLTVGVASNSGGATFYGPFGANSAGTNYALAVSQSVNADGSDDVAVAKFATAITGTSTFGGAPFRFEGSDNSSAVGTFFYTQYSYGGTGWGGAMNASWVNAYSTSDAINGNDAGYGSVADAAWWRAYHWMGGVPGAEDREIWATNPVAFLGRRGTIGPRRVKGLQAIEANWASAYDTLYRSGLRLIDWGGDLDGAAFTGSISGTVLTVTAVSSGTIEVGHVVVGGVTSDNTRIVSLGTGTGGTGTYNVSVSQTTASASMTSGAPLQGRGLWMDAAINIARSNRGNRGPMTAIGLGDWSALWPIRAGDGTLMETVLSQSITQNKPAFEAAIGFNVPDVTFNHAFIRAPGFYVSGTGNVGGNAVSGTTLQTSGSVLARTAVVGSVTVVRGGIFRIMPTLTCSASPGGGTTATVAVATMGIDVPSSMTGAGGARGTGYVVGNVLTDNAATGTATTRFQYRVDAVDSAGAIIDMSVATVGSYSVLPTNPVTLTGGSGTGATVTPFWTILTVSVSGGGTLYSEHAPPTISASGVGGQRYINPILIPVMTPTQTALSLNPGGGLAITATALGNYANDAAAAVGGVAVNGVYRNGSVLMVRVA